jgi:hypothetical protein
MLPGMFFAALAKEEPFKGGVFEYGVVEGHGTLLYDYWCRVRPFYSRIGEIEVPDVLALEKRHFVAPGSVKEVE